MDTGAFALLGHSIGCLLVTVIAKRARKELGVEPMFVFMVERGSCQYPLFTDSGNEMLKNDRVAFMNIWNPQVMAFYNSAGDVGERTMNMWQRGWFCENDTREVGFHTFKCPLQAICADSTVDTGVFVKDVPEEKKEALKRHLATRFHSLKQDDGSIFYGHFPWYTYEKWNEWTEYPPRKIVKCPAADHMSIKGNSTFKKTVFGTLLEILQKW